MNVYGMIYQHVAQPASCARAGSDTTKLQEANCAPCCSCGGQGFYQATGADSIDRNIMSVECSKNQTEAIFFMHQVYQNVPSVAHVAE